MTVKLTAQLNVVAQTKQAEQAIRQLGNKPIVLDTSFSPQGIRALTNELEKVRRKTAQVESGFEDFANKAALAGKRFAAFTVATTGFFALGSAITKAIKEASEFNVELLKVKQVTRDSANNVNSLGNEVFKVARQFGVSSKELLSVGLTLGQAGRSIQEIKDSLGSLAKTRLAATFGDITDTVNALIAAQEQFKLTSKDTEQVLGSINVLSAKYAVEAQDLTTAIQKAGGAFSTLADSTAEPKKNLNELLALFTAVRSTTRESADTIATGFRTIFARLRRPQTVDTLSLFGINLKDANGLLKKPLDQIREIARVTQSLDKRDIKFSQIIEEVGGIRQQSKVIPLLEQIGKAEEALMTATRGSNSLTRDAEIAQESLANQLAKTREEFLKLINDGFNSTAFQTTAKLILSITEGLVDMGRAVGPLIPALTALTAINFTKSVPGGGKSGFEQLATGIKRQFGAHATHKSSVVVNKYAGGGPVGGSGRGDKVPAMLEPGEFVIPRDSASKFPRGFLESIRNGQRPHGYATGGLVFNPNQVVTKPEQAQQFLSSLSKAIGIPLERVVSEVKRFTKSQERINPNKLGSTVYGEGGSASSILYKGGKATLGVLAHEFGHALENVLNQETRKNLRAITLSQDPVVKNRKTNDILSDNLRQERESLRNIKNSGGNLTSRQQGRLTYLEKITEQSARGFAQNPNKIIRANLFGGLKQYSEPAGPAMFYAGNGTPPIIPPPGQFPSGHGGNPPTPPYNSIVIPPPPPPPQPSRLSRFGNSVSGAIGNIGQRIGGVTQSISDNPVQASIISAGISATLSQFDELGDSFVTITKSINHAVTQFILLSTVLRTFGRTAKESQLLSEGANKFNEQRNRRASIDEAISRSTTLSGNAKSLEDRINRRAAFRQTRESQLSDLNIGISKNQLSDTQKADLARVKLLQKVNDKFLNTNLENTDNVKLKLAEEIHKERIKNTGKKFSGEFGKGSMSNREIALTEQYKNITAKEDEIGHTNRSQIVISQKSENDKIIKEILSKPENANLLSSSAAIKEARKQKRLLQQKIRGLKQAETRDTKELRSLITEYNDVKKLEFELREGLVTKKEYQGLKIQNALFNNRRVRGRNTRADLERRSRLESVSSLAAVGVGAIGSIISDFGDAAFEKNQGGQLSSHVGNALSTGASAGSFGLMIHPIAAAGLAVAGALYGAYQSITNVNKKLEDIQLDKELKKFTHSLDLVREGKFGASTQISTVRATVSSLGKRIAITGGKDLQDRGENLAGNVHNFLRNLASSSDNLNDFNTQSKGLIEFVSRFTNTSMKDLNKEFKELIGTSIKLKRRNKTINSALESEDARAINIVGILSSFNDLSDSLNEFEAKISGGVSDLSSVFNRLGQIQDPKLLDRANIQAQGLLGDEFVSRNNLVNKVGLQLPSILSSALQNKEETQEPIDIISKQIRELTKGDKNGEFVTNAIVTALSDRLKSDDISKELAAGNIKALLDPTLAELRKGLAEVSEQSIKLRNQELKLIENTLGRVTQLRSEQRDLSLSNVDIQEKIAIGRTPFNRIGLAESQGFDLKRLQTISGLQNPTTGNLANNLTQSRTRLQDIEKKLQTAQKEDLLNLEKARSKERENIEKTVSALKFLADASSRVAKIEDELARAKQLRETKTGILEDFAFADPEQKREMARGFAATNRVFSTGNLGSIPPHLLGAVKANLDKFSPDTKLANGQTVGDFKRNLSLRAIKRFIDPKAFEGLKKQLEKSDEEKNLQGQREEALRKAEEANNILRQDSINQEKLLTEAINKQFPDFINNLKNLINENTLRHLDFRINQKQPKLNEISKQVTKAGFLQKRLSGTQFQDLTENQINSLKQTLPEIAELTKLDKQRTRINSFKPINLTDNRLLSTEEALSKTQELYGKLEEVLGTESATELQTKLEKYITGLDSVSGGFSHGLKLSTSRPIDFLGGIFTGKNSSSLIEDEINSIIKNYLAQELSKNEDKKKGVINNLNKSGIENKDIQPLHKEFEVISGLFEDLNQFKEHGSITELTRQFELLKDTIKSLNDSSVQLGGIRKANGGYIPGAGNTDSIPAMLTPGEFVIKKSAAEKLGPNLLNQLNDTQYFASGGPVHNEKKIQDMLPGKTYNTAVDNVGSNLPKISPFDDIVQKEIPEEQVIPKRKSDEYYKRHPEDDPKNKYNNQNDRTRHLLGAQFDVIKGTGTANQKSFGKYGQQSQSSQTPTTMLGGSQVSVGENGINLIGDKVLAEQAKKAQSKKGESPLELFAKEQGKNLKNLKSKERAELRDRFIFERATQYRVVNVNGEQAKVKAKSLFSKAIPEFDRLNAHNNPNFNPPEKRSLSEMLKENQRRRDESGVSGSLGKNIVDNKYNNYSKYIKAPKHEPKKDVKEERLKQLNEEIKLHKRYSTGQSGNYKAKTSKDRLSDEEMFRRGNAQIRFQGAMNRLNSFRDRLEDTLDPYRAKPNSSVQDLVKSVTHGVPRQYRRNRNSGGGTSNYITHKNNSLECTINAESLNKFEKAISDFSKPADKLATALDNFTPNLTMEARHEVIIHINGADVLNKLQPEIEKLVIEGAKVEINKMIDSKFPQIGRV